MYMHSEWTVSSLVMLMQGVVYSCIQPLDIDMLIFLMTGGCRSSMDNYRNQHDNIFYAFRLLAC